jgi:hypothetical protein
MDRARRRTVDEDVSETFGHVRAADLCQESGGRLCTVDEFHQRAVCYHRPSGCDDQRPWTGEGIDVGRTGCVPVFDVPYENVYEARPDQLVGGQTLNAGIYIYVGTDDLERRTIFRVETCAEAQMANSWNFNGYAEYTCCLDQ